MFSISARNANSKARDTSASHTPDKSIDFPWKDLRQYRDRLDEAYAARLEMERKYHNLLSKNIYLVSELKSAQELASEFLRKLDDATFSSDMLQFQLEQTQAEVTEHQKAIKSITEKHHQSARHVTLLTLAIQQLQSELLAVSLEAAGKQTTILELEITCNGLKQKLKETEEKKSEMETDLSAAARQLEQLNWKNVVNLERPENTVETPENQTEAHGNQVQDEESDFELCDITDIMELVSIEENNKLRRQVDVMTKGFEFVKRKLVPSSLVSTRPRLPYYYYKKVDKSRSKAKLQRGSI